MSDKLRQHAELTVTLLERYQKRRNRKGLKEWERKLLESAQNALKGDIVITQTSLTDEQVS